MRQPSGAARRARIALRLSQEDRDDLQQVAKTRGYESPSALIRAAIRNELNSRSELTNTEERIAGGFERLSRDIVRLARGQQALFALLDTLAKTILTCVPEPPPDARPQAIARAKDRYDRLMKSAGQSMSNGARTAMQDLTGHGPNRERAGIPASAEEAAPHSK